jgi:2-hydroxy-6-oxonona-2,4-dienedioate hydrolase
VWLRAGGIRIHVREWGSGPPVALLHGHVISSSYMAPLGEALAPRYRVIAPDLPGCGLSPKPPRPLTIQESADLFDEIIHAAGMHRPAMIGNSMGCQIIIDLLSRRDAASRAVLIGPSIDAEARSVIRQFGRLLRDIPYERRLISLAGLYLRDHWRSGTGLSWATLQIGLADRPEDKLSKIRVPVLVVRGEHDPIAPQTWTDRIAKLLPAGRMLTIPGAGHAVHYSAPEALAEAIWPFLQPRS